MDENKKILRLAETPKQEVSDFYVNQLNLITSLYEVLFMFGLKTKPEEGPEPIVNIRMSPQHAKIVSLLLNKQIESYEKDIGKIKFPASLLKELDIDEKV